MKRPWVLVTVQTGADMGWERMELRAWQGLRPCKRQVPNKEAMKEAMMLLVSLPGAERVPPLILRLHHRRTKAPLRRVVVRSRSWLNYEGE